MVSIRLLDTEDEETEDIVKGRVFLYDDNTKTLILKIFEDDTQ